MTSYPNSGDIPCNFRTVLISILWFRLVIVVKILTRLREHGNDCRFRSRCYGPSAVRINVRTDLATILARVAQCPLLLKVRVVANHVILRDEIVGRRKLKLRIQPQFQCYRPHVSAALYSELYNSRPTLKIRLLQGTVRSDHTFFVALRSAAAKPHQQFAFPVPCQRSLDCGACLWP